MIIWDDLDVGSFGVVLLGVGIIQILIMFGFQAFSRGVLRMAARASLPQMSTFTPKHIGWSHQ